MERAPRLLLDAGERRNGQQKQGAGEQARTTWGYGIKQTKRNFIPPGHCPGRSAGATRSDALSGQAIAPVARKLQIEGVGERRHACSLCVFGSSCVADQRSCRDLVPRRHGRSCIHRRLAESRKKRTASPAPRSFGSSSQSQALSFGDLPRPRAAMRACLRGLRRCQPAENAEFDLLAFQTRRETAVRAISYGLEDIAASGGRHRVAASSEDGRGARRPQSSTRSHRLDVLDAGKAR